jgi:hypothetical protein
MNMTVGATEQKVFHYLPQNCILKMEKSQQIATENPQIDICIYFHHLGAQHIFLTTYLISNNIPYSLAYRIVQICSKPELRDAQFLKLRDFLLSRDYNSSIVDSAIVRGKAIPGEVALKKVEKKEKPDRVIFSISFNPQLPCISSIIQKH